MTNAMDPALLDAMPDPVIINQYTGDDANGNAEYNPTPINTFANIQLERSLVELRLGHGMRIQGSGADVYIPAPTFSATLIIPAQGVLPKDKIQFRGYTRYVALVTIATDQFGNPWTETLIVQETKE